MYKYISKSLILVSLILVSITSSKQVFADNKCKQTYGGGEICNKSFRITKEVSKDKDGNYKDKIVLDTDEWNDTFYFRIKVENVGEVEVDNMKYEDFLPDELEYVDSGSDGLTEEWDNFEPGETVEFFIRAKVDKDEFDNEKEFEKCVVNKVELEYDGNFEGSDTATVCYGDAEISELPKTGAGSSLALLVAGLALISTGTLVKKNILA